MIHPVKYYRDFLNHDVRPDGRELNQFRPIVINVNSIGTSDGSAIVKIGNTTVVCGIKAVSFIFIYKLLDNCLNIRNPPPIGTCPTSGHRTGRGLHRAQHRAVAAVFAQIPAGRSVRRGAGDGQSAGRHPRQLELRQPEGSVHRQGRTGLGAVLRYRLPRSRWMCAGRGVHCSVGRSEKSLVQSIISESAKKNN